MSYIIQEFSQDKYRFRLYDNVKRLTWQQIQAETGCGALLNLAYFHLTTYAHQAALMIAGQWAHPVTWHEYGICIDQSGTLTVGTEKEAVYDYAIGCPPVVINGVDKGKGEGGRNGWTYTGVKPDGTVVALLCSKDTPEYTATLEAALRARGCTHILRWDGSWSSQGTLGPGKSVTPSQRRICRSWLLIYERTGAETPGDDKEDTTMSKYTVCLDPGHGPGTVNGAPDGSYKEHEFAWDMYGRISKLLEARGIHTICTRTEDAKPSLTERAGVANRAGATCFVSIHSNAAGNGGWYDADGLEIYTSAGPETAERNVLAAELLKAFGAAGVALRASAAKHEMYTVLAETDMPAVLIEYGFHTSREDVALLLSGDYRDKLAAATADGVCKWLGVSWSDEPPAGETDRAIVQRRFNFADETMDYLCKYQYADALLERLATAD